MSFKTGIQALAKVGRWVSAAIAALAIYGATQSIDPSNSLIIGAIFVIPILVVSWLLDKFVE
ncbi:hypothetical protein V8G57_09120 [Collimonas sp. H4R21]|uniref:Uncharacterized protein n=1 Tax=Collimonas rhizosphaerae TaxID=3126357 RepID=A0ABU9PU77_9BURK